MTRIEAIEAAESIVATLTEGKFKGTDRFISDLADSIIRSNQNKTIWDLIYIGAKLQIEIDMDLYKISHNLCPAGVLEEC